MLTDLATIANEDGAIWQMDCISHDTGEGHVLLFPAWGSGAQVDSVGGAGGGGGGSGVVTGSSTKNDNLHNHAMCIRAWAHVPYIALNGAVCRATQWAPWSI